MTINFTPEEKAELVLLLQDYCRDELDQDLGRFEVEFFLEFISEKIGLAFYNKGVKDAQLILRKKMEDIDDALYALENRRA